jgi:outer membrane translocation and assembly module TamA
MMAKESTKLIKFSATAIIMMLFLAACGRGNYGTGKHILISNSIVFEKQAYILQEEKDVIAYSLDPILQPKLNLKVLGLYPLLFFHTTFKKATPKQKIRYWFKTKVGEPPVLLDTTTCEKVAKSMRYQLNHKGYYKAKASYSVKYKRHRAFVTYKVQPNERMLIDTVYFQSVDSNIQKVMLGVAKETFLKPRAPVDMLLFEQEKARLTIAIRNAGYERFTWNFMTFEADTVNARKYSAEPKKFLQDREQGEPRAVVYVNILSYSDTMLMHPRYTVRNVWVAPEDVVLQPHQQRKLKKDSTFAVVPRVGQKRHDYLLLPSADKLLPEDSIRFVFLRTKGTKPIMREQILADAIHLRADKSYSFLDTKETINSITELDVFKFTRVEYVPSSSGVKNELDCIIKMRPDKKMTISTDAEINTYNANLGSAFNLTYRNRNIFKGAEALSIKLELGGVFRTRKDSTLGADATWIDNFISLLDINTEASLYFPRFIGPSYFSRQMINARTRFAVGYRFLRQGTDLKSVSSVYARFFSYDWKSRTDVHHHFLWNPLLLTITFEPGLSQAFEEKLLESNPALLASLKDKFVIPSMDFTYTYTTPERKAANSWFVKLYGEIAGNLFYGINRIASPNQPIRFFNGIDYSQYIKADSDVRYSIYISRSQSVVLRLMAGAALPYGNSYSRGIPFSRRFFLGGPNSMRAWGLRQIGAGRVKGDPSAAFQLGDIRLEMNAEYRFKFNSWISGAVFVDAGNVWLWRSADSPILPPMVAPETGVITTKFLSELAVGTGFGIRLDFSFFIIRLDYGIQVYNPAGYGLLPSGSTQYWNFPPRFNFSFKPIENSNLVLGIGYPF